MKRFIDWDNYAMVLFRLIMTEGKTMRRSSDTSKEEHGTVHILKAGDQSSKILFEWQKNYYPPQQQKAQSI